MNVRIGFFYGWFFNGNGRTSWMNNGGVWGKLQGVVRFVLVTSVCFDLSRGFSIDNYFWFCLRIGNNFLLIFRHTTSHWYRPFATTTTWLCTRLFIIFSLNCIFILNWWTGRLGLGVLNGWSWSSFLLKKYLFFKYLKYTFLLCM